MNKSDYFSVFLWNFWVYNEYILEQYKNTFKWNLFLISFRLFFDFRIFIRLSIFLYVALMFNINQNILRGWLAGWLAGRQAVWKSEGCAVAETIIECGGISFFCMYHLSELHPCLCLLWFKILLYDYDACRLQICYFGGSVRKAQSHRHNYKFNGPYMQSF